MSDECPNYDDYNIIGMEDDLENTMLEEAKKLGYTITEENEDESNHRD